MQERSAGSACVAVSVAAGSAEEAAELARGAVGAGLAACAQHWPVVSCYVWEGEIKEEPEHLILFKTIAVAYPRLERWIVEHHSYELPEILSLAASDVFPAYMDWLEASVSLR